MQTLFNTWNICTPEHPYVEGMDGRWGHPQARQIGEDYSADGDFIEYECPVCGKKFRQELPN